MMTSFFAQGGGALSRDGDAGGEGGKKWRFLDDVICEQPLIKQIEELITHVHF